LLLAMKPAGLRAAWYRLGRTWRHQRGAYLALTILIGSVGGVALGSIAAARRTASSFSTYLASTNPSQLTIEPAGGGGGPPVPRLLVAAIQRYPHVRHVEAYAALSASLLGSDKRVTTVFNGSVLVVGSIDGLLFNQDRITVTSGHLPNPNDPHQVVVTQTAAQQLSLHLGQVIHLRFSPASGHGAARSVGLTVVGVGLLDREVVQDQIAQFPTYIVATPALTKTVTDSETNLYFGVQLDNGSRYVPQVEQRWSATEHYFTDFQVASQEVVEAQDSIRPIALALGVFGGIAALAAVLLAIQAISRQLHGRDEDLVVLRAIGAGPDATILDGLIGIVGSILAGALLAFAVAVALSPIAPIGPVRQVYPDPGVDLDWTVLGFGVAGLIVLLCSSATLLSFFDAPQRAGRRQRSVTRRSGAVDLSGRLGLPSPALTGIRFALEASRSGTAEASLWTVLGAVLAVVVVTATVTFGSSLQALVSRPSLYGWNWDYAVLGSDGYGSVPNKALATVASDKSVSAASGVWFATLQLDGVEVPTLLGYPGARVAPPVVSGHGLDSQDQIVLGASTLTELHESVGDTVDVQYVPGSPKPPLRLVIVGVATMPAIGIAEGLHTSMGVGALVPANADGMTEMLGPQAYPGCNGPNMVFLRGRNGVGSGDVRVAAERLAATANQALAEAPNTGNCGGNVATVLGVQRPAQIVNYRSMGATPVLLAAALAIGTIAVLGLALASSVRRHRRDFALLKTLGFTQGQVASSVSWQASVPAVVGVVVGVPLGIALGRWLWDLFAQEIGAVPSPVVPVWSIVVVGAATLILANVVAAWPGRSAARIHPAVVLHDP
jgi:ABC-type lipoprotein release transport system permease subunit